MSYEIPERQKRTEKRLKRLGEMERVSPVLVADIDATRTEKRELGAGAVWGEKTV